VTDTTKSVTATATTTTTVTATTTTIKEVEECRDHVAPSGAIWIDKDGDHCLNYTKFDWCDSTVGSAGGYGGAWGDFGDTFETYARDTMHGGQACCDCGGGTRSYQTSAPEPWSCCTGGSADCCQTGEDHVTCPAIGATGTASYKFQGINRGDDSTMISKRQMKHGNDDGTISLDSCADLCTKNPECQAFTWKKQNSLWNYCELLGKGSGHKLVPNMRWAFYDKINLCF
jgi:hypothetical protein